MVFGDLPFLHTPAAVRAIILGSSHARVTSPTVGVRSRHPHAPAHNPGIVEDDPGAAAGTEPDVLPETGTPDDLLAIGLLGVVATLGGCLLVVGGRRVRA